MTLGFQLGSTSGAGGSYGGLGGATAGGTPNPIYGNLTNPNEPGSGGGTFSAPAGNGGGLIRIAANTLTLNGAIRANGGPAQAGGSVAGGSGGGIRIDVGTISGSGSISANGSQGFQVSGGGGGGRVAIYYLNSASFNFANATAVGGAGSPNGQNGTVHIQQQSAMLLPSDEQMPVMRADIENDPSSNDPIRLTLADSIRMTNHVDIATRRLSDPSIVNRQPAILKTQQNLYNAMVTEGKIKPFASIAIASDDTSVSGISGGFNDATRNAHSETKNASVDECCPLPSSKLATHSASPTPDDLDPVYTYDLNGNRTSMIDPTGLTTYTYDALNRLVSVTNNKGQMTSFTYDTLGRRASLTHANGVVTSYTYDAASQLTRLAHQLGATTINSFDYAYDRVGNRTSKTTRDGAHNYSYDTLNRLTQAVNPLPSNPLETFSYDPLGNRISSNQNGSSAFNQANELLEDVKFTYQYDNNGNMIQKTAKAGGAITTYEYDAENKLVRIVSPANTVKYRYDGLGRRVEKEVIAGTTTIAKYIYDNEDILLELDGTNAIIGRYTHGPGIDEPLIVEKSGQSFYYHADGLSSITELTNQSGAVVQRYTYSSFGKIESQLDSNFVQPYAYTAREADSESGLNFYRTRYYDPSIGRFFQQDFIGFIGGNNFYSYVGNNPVYFVDPLGLDALDWTANYSAGFGDMVTFGLTNYIRQGLGVNHVVDLCSTAYSAGWWTGMFHQLAFSGAGAFSGGARSVFYSGEGSLEAARAGKGAGRLLEDTLGGKLLNIIDQRYPIPDGIWSEVSRIFSLNAKGDAQVFLRNPDPAKTWSMVEKPLLDIVNKIHSAVGGTPATKIVLR